MEAASTNGESDLDVGACIALDQSARGRLFAIELEIKETMVKLGSIREKYLQNEQMLLEQIKQHRQRYSSEAISSGAQAGASIDPRSGQKWDFNSDEMTFTRVK